MLNYDIIVIDIFNKEDLKGILLLISFNKYYLNTTVFF
jgi:hypothetical protein